MQGLYIATGTKRNRTACFVHSTSCRRDLSKEAIATSIQWTTLCIELLHRVQRGESIWTLGKYPSTSEIFFFLTIRKVFWLYLSVRPFVFLYFWKIRYLIRKCPLQWYIHIYIYIPFIYHIYVSHVFSRSSTSQSR